MLYCATLVYHNPEPKSKKKINKTKEKTEHLFRHSASFVLIYLYWFSDIP
jgi:hypothetical protein